MRSSHQDQPQPIISMDPVTVESSVGGGSSSCSSTGSNDYAYRPLTTTSKHRRAGSTGTTGDEEYSSDEDELYGDEADCCPVMGPGGLIQPGVVDLKSDLARAATDLFGYAKHERGDDEEVEPTSLFDDDEQQQQHFSCSRSSKPVSLYAAYNAESSLASRRRLSNCSDKLKITSGAKSQQQQQLEDEQTKTQPLDRRRRDSQKEEDQRQSEKSASVCNGEIRQRETTTTTTAAKLDLDSNIPAEVDKKPATTTSNCSSSADDDHEEISTATSDPPSPSTVQWGRAVAEVKEQAIAKLQDELRRAHEELKLKDEEVARLSRIRQDVEAELEELTASLFQEAHNMVREANQRQATAERLLEESRMKAEVLAAEVAALKTLVLTSTPAQPNPHLHPQIADEAHHHHHHHNHHQSTNGGIFAKRHRRSPSHFNLKYGREGSPPESPLREPRTSLPIGAGSGVCNSGSCGALGGDRDSGDCRETEENQRDRERKRERYLISQLVNNEKERDKEARDLGLEVDPRVHDEFLAWKASPCVDKADPFVERIFREDIELCLDFPNSELGSRVRQAVLDGIIFVEAVSDKTKLGFPKKCALLEAPRQCHYRMRIGDQENQWYCISQICRNRIIAVCDFLNYLRYIERGLVKSCVNDVFWEITRLRKEMVLARLGLALSV